MNGELFDQHLDTLERSLQTLSDQAHGLPGAGKALAPALQEVGQALTAVRAAREAEVRSLKKNDGSQRRSAIVGTMLDLAERQQVEENLRHSEEKYRRLIETTNTGYLVIDSEGKVLDANQEYVRISEHNRLEEILGRNVIEWISERDRERSAAEVTCPPQTDPPVMLE